ncbi:hypothetical protein PSAB6_470170 [Paraburkholderia sabiae]|nr:hypothetical protein PSAB6_470170 [Paraburkholderia sabiae]
MVVEAGGGLQATCRAASTCEKRADVPRAFYFERLFAIRVLLFGCRDLCRNSWQSIVLRGRGVQSRAL